MMQECVTLVNASDDINSTNISLFVYRVINKNDTECMEMLIMRGLKIPVLTSWGSPLRYACKHGKAGIVKLMIESKADINECKAIYSAYGQNQPECVKLLIESRADVKDVWQWIQNNGPTGARQTCHDLIKKEANKQKHVT